MTTYAALLSLAHTTDLSRTMYESISTSNALENVRSIHVYVNSLLSSFEQFPEKINRWECRIRDVAYDAEDIIEVFVWQQIQSRDSNIYPSRELEVQLQDVTEKIGSIAGEVTEERPAYLPPSSSPSSSSRLAAVGNDEVIGLDDDIMAIKERLCGHSSNLQVIPIVGMGGIGKSTLAKTLYEDQLIIETFRIRASVVVSQDYTPHRLKKILLDLLKLLEEEISGDMMDQPDIPLKVFQILKGRKYLVVLDDVWETNFLDDVWKMFPNDNNGSRIMLTTRQLDVATHPYSAGPVHEMHFMDDSQSWDLLKLKVFGNRNCPSELEEVGENIARRCAGLPLAVVLVAGVLSLVSETQASWEEIANKVNPVVGREIDKILSLSYTYLPHHLRPCFLFTGCFVEDVNIRSSRLIRLWVAEGFVKHRHECNKSLEEEAEEYMEDLVKRNLMIVTSRKNDGKIKSCSLHDMVRDLCMSKVPEEKFLHVRNGRYLPLMNKRRIIFSHSNKSTIRGEAFLTILGSQDMPSLLRSYKLLRVLDALAVELTDLTELPSEVFELYHLRYLAVIGCFSIPSLVHNLVNLQTLIVHLASGKLQKRFDDGVRCLLPLEIWRMPQLRHLIFHAPYMLPHPPEGINYLPLENLQTLLLIKDLVWDEKIIRMIPNVKKLGLLYTTSQEYNLDRLKDLPRLVKLEVTGYLKFSWSIRTPSFPLTLKKLTLVGGNFQWKHMVVVGSLPCLEVLKLLADACDGDSWEITNEAFPQLEVLLIDESYVREWITHGSPFPTLKHLVLRSCMYLIEIPKDVGEILTLQLIDLDNCTKSLSESAKKIKEDQESYGNDALQVRVGREYQTYFTQKRIEETRIFSSPPMAGLPDLEEGCSGGMVAKIFEKAPTQIICGKGIFKEKDFKDFLKSVKLPGGSYVVVAIMGPQSSGKSTLMNHLFYTNFKEMNVVNGRSKTTRGVWIENAKQMEPYTIVLDLEGRDGQERGEDNTTFERQTAAFALAVADVIIVNMWCHEVGREHAANRPLLKAIFEAMLHLFGSHKKTLLFVLRDTTKTPVDRLEKDLKKDVEKIWKTAIKPQGSEDTPLAQNFNLMVTALSNYEHMEDTFKEEVAQLRSQFPSMRNNVERTFSFKNAKKIWDIVKQDKNLDLPSQKIMIATVRCEEIAIEKLRLFESDKEWLALQQAAASKLVSDFSIRISSILDKYLKEYDVDCTRYEKDVSKAKREYLISEVLKVVHPTYRNTLERRRLVASREFETQLKAALIEEKGFADSVKTCKEFCERLFDEQCASDHESFSNDISTVRRELLRDIENTWQRVRADKMPQVVEQIREKLSVTLSKELSYILTELGDKDTWESIRDVVKRESDAAALALRPAIAGFALDPPSIDDMVSDLKRTARESMAKKFKEETQDVPTLLKQRYITALYEIDSELSDDDEQVDQAEPTKEVAYRKCVKLLSTVAVIRLDETIGVLVEKELHSALLAADGISPDTLVDSDSDTWPEVPPEMTLLTPAGCRDIWYLFKRDMEQVHANAKYVEDHCEQVNHDRPSTWVIIGLLALGLHSFMKLINICRLNSLLASLGISKLMEGIGEDIIKDPAKLSKKLEELKHQGEKGLKKFLKLLKQLLARFCEFMESLLPSIIEATNISLQIYQNLSCN